MEEGLKGKWENFLDPDRVRPNLIIASLYIAAFELLKNTITERLKSFFTVGFGPDGLSIDPAYATDVLARNRSPLYASLEWLKSMNAIDDTDMAAYERTKLCRNTLTHEIPKLLVDGFPTELNERFAELIGLVDKIERWWIVNVEMSINSEFDGVEIDEKGIIPGAVLMLRLMMDIALCSDEESRRYLNEWHRITTKNTTQEVDR